MDMSSQTLRCKLSSKDLLLRADPVKQKSNRLSQSISPSNGGWDNDLESQLVRSQLQPLYHSLIGCWLSQRFSFFRSRSFFLLTKCMILPPIMLLCCSLLCLTHIGRYMLEITSNILRNCLSEVLL